eukprot:12923212-Prorocentrum_lima.AAC.1
MATHEHLAALDPDTDTESEDEATIFDDEDYRSMLAMIGTSERHTREEANWHLYEHYCDAKILRC